MNDNMADISAFRVSVVEHCKFDFGAWVVHLHAFGSRALRFQGLVIKAKVSGGEFFPLACRHGPVASAGYSFLLVALRMFRTVSLVPVRGVIVVYC